MSNLAILAAATDPTTAPANLDSRADVYIYAALIVATALAVLLIVVLGLWRPSRMVGPLRVQPGRPVWPLLVVGGVGAGVWFGAQVVYVFIRAFQLAREHGPGTQPTLSDFTPSDYAVLATVPGVAGFVCLLAGDRLFGRWSAAWLGFSLRKLRAGVASGLVASLIVLPLILWVSEGLEYVYKWLRFEHPKEHELLKVMVEAPTPWEKWLLIAGAVLVAPFFEEYLFRGHLQTLLRHALLRMKGRGDAGFEPAPVMAAPYPAWPPGYPAPTQMPPPGEPGVGAVPFAGMAPPFIPPPLVPPSEPAPDRPPLPEVPAIWPAVIAILLTSLCFSIVHPIWTWPVIFVLSCMLGYAYERTGNLWTNIVIHAVFNGFSTILYLTVLH
jgi:membrane protease YdiL (CAAX protease family)